MSIIHISWGGPDRTIVDEAGKAWKFEDHPYCGPTLIDARGNVKAKQPEEKSAFWRCINPWIEQGKRVAANGVCIWRPEEKHDLVNIGGRNYAHKNSDIAKQFGCRKTTRNK